MSNEGGRAATESDFQINSAGTEIVANSLHQVTAITGYGFRCRPVASMKVTGDDPDRPAPDRDWRSTAADLLVTNTYSDTISVIDTNHQRGQVRTDLYFPTD